MFPKPFQGAPCCESPVLMVSHRPRAGIIPRSTSVYITRRGHQVATKLRRLRQLQQLASCAGLHRKKFLPARVINQ